MAKNSDLYEQVIKGGYDVRSGVYSYIDDSIRMELNEYGEYQATADDIKVFNNPKLKEVSAMLSSKNESIIAEKLFSRQKGVKHDQAVGYYLDLYAGYVSEGDYREAGSSGGVATWLACRLIEDGLIDGLIHVKPSDAKSGTLFQYAISETTDEIKDGAKSRYYPAELSQVLREVGISNKKYAITAIPSIAMEIRLLADQDERISKRIKFIIGLIAGHQKSTKYTDALAWEQGIKPGDLVSIDYRKKVDGKLSYEYNTEFTGYINGELKTFTSQSSRSFVGNWGHGFFKSKLSDFTDDTFNETADVVLGDAWLPQYTSDSKGTNIVIVRNRVISDIIADGVKRGLLHVDKLAPDVVKRSQRGLIHHTQDELPYRLYKKDKAGVWRPKKRFDASNHLPLLRKRVQDIREDISTKSHIAFKDAVDRSDWGYFVRHMEPYTVRYRLLYSLINIKGKSPIWIAKKVYKKVFRS